MADGSTIWFRRSVMVRASAIHGQGLFTTSSIDENLLNTSPEVGY